MKRFFEILKCFTVWSVNAKVATVGFLIVTCMATTFVGCSGGSAKGEKIEIDEPIKSFLKNTLKDNYSFYALKDHLPVTMDDLRGNGIFIGSRVPEGLLTANVINQLYGGGFLSGTLLTLDGKSEGMEKFDGVRLVIAIGITPDGCVNALRENGVKQIILFSDDDIKRVKNSNELVKVVF